MARTNKILIIDDSKLIREMITQSMPDSFEIISAVNGKEALDECDKHQFLVIVVDIEMPVMDGFEFVETLKTRDLNYRPSVVFMSSRDDVDTVLKCFEAGADDFVTKAFEGDALIKKLTALTLYKSQVDTLEIEEKNLTSLVDVTMKQASFYGMSVNLLADLHQSQDEMALSDHIFSFMSQCGLSAAVHFENDIDGQNIIQYDQQTGICSPIEQRVFELLRQQGRIYEFGCRSMFNDEHVSLLIKNMPDKDSTEYGLLIDVIAKLVPAIEAHYLNLVRTSQLRKTQNDLDEVVNDLQKGMEHLNAERALIISNLVADIHGCFHALDFNDEQERYLIHLIESGVSKSDNSNVQFDKINQDIESMKVRLQQSLAVTTQTTETNESTLDIELF